MLTDDQLIELEGAARDIQAMAENIEALASMEIDEEADGAAPFELADLESIQKAKEELSAIQTRRGEEG